MEAMHAQFLQRYHFGAHCTRFGAKCTKWEPLACELCVLPHTLASERQTNLDVLHTNRKFICRETQWSSSFSSGAGQGR